MSSAASSRPLREDDPSLLAVLIDVNPQFWVTRQQEHDNGAPSSPFLKVVSEVFAFVNAFLLLNRGNKLAIIASHPRESRFLYPVDQGAGSKKDSEQSFSFVNQQVMQSLEMLVSSGTADADASQNSRFAGSLSLALCYINRMKYEYPNIHPRILMLCASEDLSSEYISVMNCIFSAQKQHVPLDVCLLTPKDSLFMQQAAYLTKGIYWKPKYSHTLIQDFMTIFLPDLYSRQHLILPKGDQVDFRASCFCHRKIIDVGYVCPVCLSVFCKETTKCKTCGTRMPRKLISNKNSRLKFEK